MMAALFVISLVQAFAVTSTMAEEEPEESVLRIGLLGELDVLNPHIAFSDNSLLFCSLVYDCLQSVGGGFESEPNLALGWGPLAVEDPIMIANGKPFGSVWGFNLTTNAQWHDGEPFTADDVVYSMNLLAEDYASMWMYEPYTYYIDYAEKLNDRTVLLHFFDRETEEPMPVAFADSLLIPIMPKHILETMSAYDVGFSWNGMVDGHSPPVVGTGPFKVTDNIQQEVVDGNVITLVRNPDHHWETDRGISVSVDRLELVLFDDPQVMSLALRTDQIDVAQFPRQEYIVLKDDVSSGEVDDITTFDGPKCTQHWSDIMINMNNEGPNEARLDPTIRQALAMGTDKSSIVDDFYLGLADEASTLVPSVNIDWHFNLPAEDIYEYDLEAANQLLEDAGYVFTVSSPDIRMASADSYAVQQGIVPEGTKLEFEMAVSSERPEDEEIAGFLQQEWMEMGVYVDYYILDELALSATVYSYDYDMAIWYWTSDPDPNHILFTQSRVSWNDWSDNMYSSDAYEENYTASVMELDIEMRRLYVDNCQKVHYIDAPYIIMACPYQTYAWRTDHFIGWGDWAEEPCRSIDSYWGGNLLYFELEPISDGPVDEEAPTTYAFVSTPDGEEDWHLTNAEVQLTATDDISGVDYTRYRIDVGSWHNYDGPVSIETTGTHVFQYYSVDNVGNVEGVEAVDIKVDASAPVLWILQADEIEFDSSTITLGWSCTDFGSGIGLVEVSIDGATYQDIDALDTWESETDPLSTFLNLTDVATGDHTFSVRVHDVAGHVSTASIDFSVRENSNIMGLSPLAFGLVLAAIAGAVAAAAFVILRPRKGAG